jgi:hypothetical protein
LALPIIRSSQMLESELNKTFCRLTITEPGTDFIHPESTMNQTTAAKPITAASACFCAREGGLVIFCNVAACCMRPTLSQTVAAARISSFSL